MKVVGLVSGGKDSCYAMMKCIEYGHEIVAVANLLPVEDSVDELDSYMYQTEIIFHMLKPNYVLLDETFSFSMQEFSNLALCSSLYRVPGNLKQQFPFWVGHQIVVSYAECMGVPLFRKRIQGSTRHHNLSYKVTAGDEVEDLFILLKEVKKQIPLIEGVSSGAIASDYQRLRVESVCSRLGLISLAFLWKQDQSLLLQEMIGKSIKAIIVKVAAIGLEPKKHLGKEIGHLESYLHKLKELYGINVCGEGGEYETLTLDCPLFKNAQIVLDEFDIVLHSADSIASVGILHPSAFHLEYKQGTEPSCDSDRSSGIFQGNNVTVCEVQGDCLESCEVECSTIDQSLDLPAVTNYKLHTSKTRKDDIFSISCCLLNPCKTSVDLQEHLKALLTKVELQLVECGFSWESVLYIHLYISDMNAFAEANATYVSFITHDKCRFGVPSRSTIELPLSEVGLGRAYIEVLVANDQTKRVLHVQSISCWAPSCIGPYSQATLHKEILYMAGQLGLDPPTMLLCGGGPIAELKQALQNSEAVAQSFHCSVSTSSIFLIIYCSKSIPHTERSAMNDELDAFLKRTKLLCSRSQNKSELLDPIILYVLVPDLPKRAFVEVKPVLYVAEDTETNPEVVTQDLCCYTTKTYWGFHHEDWHDSCFQKCVVAEKICAVVLSVTGELAQKICSEPAETNLKRMNRVAQFCIVLINKILSENHFSWSDITNLRFHYPTSLQISHESLTQIVMGVFRDFATMNQSIQISEEPIFNLVPVLGAGRSPTFMEDILTCELLAQKS